MATKSREIDVSHYARITIHKPGGEATVSINGARQDGVYKNRTEAEKSLAPGFVLIQVDVKPKKLGKPDPNVEKVYCYERIERLEVKNCNGK
jgi:hypothetical protein